MCGKTVYRGAASEADVAQAISEPLLSQNNAANVTRTAAGREASAALH